jgi:hypothetical protein
MAWAVGPGGVAHHAVNIMSNIMPKRSMGVLGSLSGLAIDHILLDASHFHI